MTKTLQPEDIIAQYRVVGPLGAGGMGEVYLAQDQMLERNVALKVLPPDVVRNEDRVRRFMQEAKSASSLNHPNIVTIYEIGSEKVKSSSGSESGPLQFISMELVSGKTLGAKIHEEKTDLRTLLGYLAQAAEGLAKAHAAGIVHRDLKPGNIMVSEDGFTKVLDFGLAKLTEKRLESASATAMTELADLTSEGAVIGTVHYMSPEQVQGKSVDHRSDVFSFGCLLYEAATRRRPFVAESNVETMHKILHEKPTPIEELNPQAPAELRRLIRRCLAKAPDQRLQSMKDVAIELREIVDEYDTLSASATSATTTSTVRALPAPKKRAWLPIVIGAAVLAILVVGYLATRRDEAPAPVPFQNMRATTQTSRGDILFSALSDDGRYLAYIAGAAGRWTLRVRQVVTGSDVEILPLQNAQIESPSFSPDGNYLFYLKRLPEQPAYRTLVRVPSLGGPEEQKGFDVDSRVTFSPDAKSVCFMRGIPQENRNAFFIRDIEKGTERELLSVRRPENVGAPSWSPDGKRIAAPIVTQVPALKATLAMFDAQTGAREDFITRKDAAFVDVTWIPDGSGLVLAGTIITEGLRNQLFLIPYPRGELRRITNDFDEYNEVSVASGEGAISAVRTTQIMNLYIADPASPDGTARRITSATSAEHSAFGLEVVDGGVLYPSIYEHRMGIAMLPATGGEPRRIQVGPGHATNVIARGSKVAFQRFDDDGGQHIWRVNADGSGLAQITHGTGELLVDMSDDGSLISYATQDSTQTLWLIPYAGGEATSFAVGTLFGTGFFSRDGSQIVAATLEPDAGGLVQVVFKVMSVADKSVVQSFKQPPSALDPSEGPDARWSAINRDDPARNIYLYGVDGTVKQVTRFTDGRLSDHEWSRDFRRIAVVRRDDVGENVWVVNADGSSPKQITRFDGLDVAEMSWSTDNRYIAVRAGTASKDVVLIKNFD